MQHLVPALCEGVKSCLGNINLAARAAWVGARGPLLTFQFNVKKPDRISALC